MRIKLKRLLGILISLALAIGMMPAMSLTAFAADATELTYDTVTWENGYYVVPADGVTISGQITVNGTVNLILTEGATLTANKGITLSNDAKLKVKGTGTMVVNGTNGADYTSRGVESTAESGSSAISGGGTLIWNSGTLTAKGGKGGNMNDYGPECKAGQGASAISCALTVNGGTLTATGGNGGNLTNGYGPEGRAGNGGAGISGALTVNGGTVTATGGDRGTQAGGPGSTNGSIGMGVSSTLTLGANVKLYEGTEANDEKLLDGDDDASRAYTGEKKQNMYAYGPDYVAEADKKALNNAIISAETIYIGIKSNTEYADIASTLKTEIDTAKAVADNVEADQDAVDTTTINLSTAITTAEAALSMIGAQTTWENETYYVPKNGATIAGHITVSGTVNLILQADATLTASAGITLSEGATLNISGGGTMVVNGSNGNANSTAEGAGTLILKNGTLTVKGGTGGSLGDDSYNQTAGVGGAAINGDVIVNGGTLTATGGTSGNLGSYNAYCKSGDGGVAINGAVTVNGGTMTAAVGARGSVGSYPASSSTGAGGAGYSGTLTLGKNIKLYEGTEANDEKLLDGNDGSSRVYEGEKKANMFAQGTDKSALNDAIIEAEFLYYSIKDNTDYSDIATTLKTALDTAKGVADNIEADQDAVDTATTTLGNALKEAKDTKAVIDEIKDLPESIALTTDNYTTYKDAINKADADYNALSEDAQKNVPDALQNKLKACKAVIDPLEFAAYKEEQKTEADNKAQAGDSDAATALITNAKKAIDDLDFDESKTLDQNKEAVTAVITQLTTDLADQRAADSVIAQINALDEGDDITTADKEAIETARKAYNDLTEDQKKKVSAETLKKLTDVEEALAAALEVAAVSEAINALPSADSVTIDNKDAVKDTRVAYNALTDKQKEKITAETLKKLTDAETALAAVTVSDTIDDLPSANDVATDHKDAIEKARAAFDALSAEQKEQVSTDTLSKLKLCELALAIAELPEANTVTTNDKPAIEAVRESFKNLTPEQQAKVPTAVLAKLQACELVITIGELPEANAVTTANKKAIEDARSAYNSLNDEQKNKISADALLKLELAEIALAIAELPDADKVTGTDKATIEAASANYKKLTNEQRTKIGDVAATKLEAVEAALKIAELPEENAVTTTNKEAIEAAREAYDKLSDAQKSQVGETFKSKLEANEVALAKKLIEAIPDPGEITTGDTEKVVVAKTAYDKLSDAQKENISEAEKDKIAAAEQAIKDTAAAQTAIDKLNALPAAADITAANRDTIVAARAAYDALSDEQKAKVTADTLNKLTAAEVKLAQIAMSEVSAKSDSDVVFTGNSIQLINTPTTALSEGHRIVYAVTTENEAPADSLYTADIPVGTGAGTYHVWYKVVDAENHDVTTPSHVAVTIEKGNSSSSGSQANTSSEESGLIYSGHAQELVTAGTAEGGTMVYALGEDGDHAPANEKFTEEIPKGTEAKTYYVWYKVKGDANHSDTNPVCIPVTITAVDVKADTMIVSDGKDTSVGTEKPQVSDGLKEQAVSEAAATDGKKVVLNLIITPQGQDEVSDSAYLESDQQMQSKVKSQYKDEGLVAVDVLDIYIEKFVDENQEANVTKTDKVIEIGMAYDFTGKYDVVVVRDHEGSAQNFTALSSRPAAADYRDATFFADVPNNKLYIYSNLFSKYVVAYSTVEGNARPAAVASSSSSSSSEPTTVPVYRLFNKLTGTHFYTANKVERDLLLEQNANAGWIDEGIAFQTAVTSSTPVYRVFDATKGIHLYTADAATRDTYIASGCRDEGIAWYAAVSVGRKVYKVSNPKNGYVLYTTSKAEADGLANVGFTSQEAEFVVY